MFFSILQRVKKIKEQLLSVNQGQWTAMDYLLEFCTLAAESGWNELVLNVAYHTALNPEVIA